MKDRITKIMEKYGLTTAEFANKITIPVGTVTAALGRNKTVNSTILQAIMRSFPEINAEWLLMNTGTMMKGDKPILEPGLFDESPLYPPNPPEAPEYRKEKPLKTPPKPSNPVDIQAVIPPKTGFKKIDKVVVFFTDGTYTTLHPEG